MKYYYVKLFNLPITSIHRASLEHKFFYDKDSKHSAYLNINGRLCHNLKYSICDSEEKAIELFNYWQPQLDNRNYGKYSFIIESNYANKWQQGYLASNLEKLSMLFLTKPNCNIPKRILKSDFPISHEGLYIVELITETEQKYYVSSFKNNGAIKAVNFLSGAKIYKNKTLCLNKIQKVNMKNIKGLYLLPVSEQQFLEIKNDKEKPYY